KLPSEELPGSEVHVARIRGSRGFGTTRTRSWVRPDRGGTRIGSGRSSIARPPCRRLKAEAPLGKARRAMDDYPIRSISADELPAFEEVLALAFHESGIDEHLKDDQLIAEPDRWFVATDDGRMGGTAGVLPTPPTAPAAARP